MSGPASEDAILLTKCFEFCQALSSQGQLFNISISTGSGFSFSLDTRSKAVNSQSQKKKASPSTLRRNAKRREEFLARKQQTSPTTESSGDEITSATPKCDHCEDAAFSPVHQCEIAGQGPWKEDAYLEAGLDECPECHAKRPNRCNFFEHPYVPKK